MGALETVRAPYAAAGAALLALVEQVPADRYDGPGLGAWDLRALIGHTGRAFGTVATYLGTRADELVARSPAEYLAVSAGAFRGQDADIQRRGIEAGRALGDDPVGFLHGLRASAEKALDDLDGEDPVVQTVIGGMHVSDYLPTRTFELTVHALDISAAVGISFTPPRDALAMALQVAVDAAGDEGRGVEVLLALTGRAALPDDFSVVP